MAITREPDYPSEYAQLANAFNHCSDGYSAEAVLNASLQMLVIAIGFTCKARLCSLDEAKEFTAHVCGAVTKEVENNWNREPKPTDVKVEQQ